MVEDIAREGRLGQTPVRVTATAAWVHDFMAGPREMSVAWAGMEQARWTISSGRNPSDAVRVGGAFEIGMGDRRTLRLYGEQEFLQGRKVLRAGVNGGGCPLQTSQTIAACRSARIGSSQVGMNSCATKSW